MTAVIYVYYIDFIIYALQSIRAKKTRVNGYNRYENRGGINAPSLIIAFFFCILFTGKDT